MGELVGLFVVGLFVGDMLGLFVGECLKKQVLVKTIYKTRDKKKVISRKG